MTDYQRRKQREREKIIKQVKESGGMSVFWTTANDIRARVADEMIERGELVRTRGYNGFPWSTFRITKKWKP